MKDKNGIDIIRENCEHKTPCNGCGLVERDCKVGDKYCQFTPSLNALEARITELQAREFTRAELQMNDKIKACCENCADSDSYCNKRGFCNWYNGTGQTPEQRIAELEAENKILLDDLSKVQADCLKCEHGDVR